MRLFTAYLLLIYCLLMRLFTAYWWGYLLLIIYCLLFTAYWWGYLLLIYCLFTAYLLLIGELIYCLLMRLFTAYLLFIYCLFTAYYLLLIDEVIYCLLMRLFTAYWWGFLLFQRLLSMLLAPLQELSAILHPDIRQKQLECVLQILHGDGETLNEGWPLVLSVIGAVTNDQTWVEDMGSLWFSMWDGFFSPQVSACRILLHF